MSKKKDEFYELLKSKKYYDAMVDSIILASSVYNIDCKKEDKEMAAGVEQMAMTLLEKDDSFAEAFMHYALEMICYELYVKLMVDVNSISEDEKMDRMLENAKDILKKLMCDITKGE